MYGSADADKVLFKLSGKPVWHVMRLAKKLDVLIAVLFDGSRFSKF